MGQIFVPPRANPPVKLNLQTFAAKPLILSYSFSPVNKYAVERRGILHVYEYSRNSLEEINPKIVQRGWIYPEAVWLNIVILEEFFFTIFLFGNLFFGTILGCEKFGGVVEIGKNFIVQVEIFIPYIRQGGLQLSFFTQGLDLLPSTIFAVTVLRRNLPLSHAGIRWDFYFDGVFFSFPFHC